MNRLLWGLPVLVLAPAAYLAIRSLLDWAHANDPWRWDDTALEHRHWWVRLDADRPAGTTNQTKENRNA